MKHAFLLTVTLLLALTQVHAAPTKLEVLQVGRYTRQGAEVLVESGFLSFSTKKFESSGGALYPESSLGIPASALTAINGKFVAFKATIDTYNQTIPGFLDNYSFSTAYYPVVGGDAYIASFASGTDASAPSASVAVSKSSLNEGSKISSKLTVTLNKATKSDITVRYKVSGSARKNSDYQVSGTDGIVKIKAGKKSGFVTVKLLDDKQKEPAENIVINLLAGSNYKLGGTKKSTIKITDNDK